MQTEKPRISIVVATCHRPEGIKSCLESLLNQVCEISFEIVVVENEEGQPSKSIIESFISPALKKGIDLRYAYEEQCGVSYVRNRSIAEAHGEYIAMIDDDEIAFPDWLQQLWNVHKQTDADVVLGRLVFDFATGFPEYLKQISFYVSDQQVANREAFRIYGFSNGCTLFKVSVLDREPIYDTSFAKLGLEDADLAMYLIMQGRLIFRAPKAIVSETQPLSRGTPWFFINRSMREGIVMSKVALKNFGRINGVKFIIWKAWRNSLMLLWYSLGMFIHPRAALVNMAIQLAHIIGYGLYFLGISWAGYGK